MGCENSEHWRRQCHIHTPGSWRTKHLRLCPTEPQSGSGIIIAVVPLESKLLINPWPCWPGLDCCCARGCAMSHYCCFGIPLLLCVLFGFDATLVGKNKLLEFVLFQDGIHHSKPEKSCRAQCVVLLMTMMHAMRAYMLECPGWPADQCLAAPIAVGATARSWCAAQL